MASIGSPREPRLRSWGPARTSAVKSADPIWQPGPLKLDEPGRMISMGPDAFAFRYRDETDGGARGSHRQTRATGLGESTANLDNEVGVGPYAGHRASGIRSGCSGRDSHVTATRLDTRHVHVEGLRPSRRCRTPSAGPCRYST